MYFNKLIFGLILLFVMVSNVFAQTNSNDETAYDEFETHGWTFGAGISHIGFDEEIATAQKIGDTAFSVDLFASYYFSSRLAATAGFGFIQLDDEAAFTQQVVATDIFGSDVETANSDASASQVFGELVYLLTNASSAVQFKAGVGFGTIASSKRKIDNCTDCREEDIELEGGAYGTASVYTGVADDQYNIGLGGRQYFSGDIKNTATLWFEYIYY